MPKNKETTATTGADDNGQEQTEEKGEASTDAEVIKLDNDLDDLENDLDQDPDNPENPEIPPDAAASAIGSTAGGTKANAQKAKKAADTKRRNQAIKNYPEQPGPTKKEVAEQERKEAIQAELVELQDVEAEHTAAIEEIKKQKCALMAKLYPHMTKSDRHAVAVRGYIASQKKIRAARATDPARFAAMLKQAGKAPIDAAFNVQRARGAGRPNPGQVAAKPATEAQE